MDFGGVKGVGKGCSRGVRTGGGKGVKGKGTEKLEREIMHV